MSRPAQLDTRRGVIRLPAYVPVTTFGGKYPLDDLLRPYLPRLADAVMISYHYARQAREEELPDLPRLVDSGGFASLFERARVVEEGGLGIIEVITDDGIDRIHPRDVLDLQERIADIAFPLDFPIPPATQRSLAEKRLSLTLANARWALDNRRRRDLAMFGCVQGWDVASYTACATSLVEMGYEGVAIGGLVPRAGDRPLVTAVVRAVRAVAGDHPVHVFGIGSPDLVALVYEAGADSVDSSAWVKAAADGRLWGSSRAIPADLSVAERLHVALCNLAIVRGRALPLGMSRLFFEPAGPVLAIS